RRIHGMREGADQERVAIRCGLGHRIVADHAAGTRAVIDYDRLAERFLELRPDQARRGVGTATGRIGHDDANGLAGIVLRTCVSLYGEDGGAKQGGSAGDGHGVLVCLRAIWLPSARCSQRMKAKPSCKGTPNITMPMANSTSRPPSEG